MKQGVEFYFTIVCGTLDLAFADSHACVYNCIYLLTFAYWLFSRLADACFGYLLWFISNNSQIYNTMTLKVAKIARHGVFGGQYNTSSRVFRILRRLQNEPCNKSEAVRTSNNKIKRIVILAVISILVQ